MCRYSNFEQAREPEEVYLRIDLRRLHSGNRDIANLGLKAAEELAAHLTWQDVNTILLWHHYFQHSLYELRDKIQVWQRREQVRKMEAEKAERRAKSALQPAFNNGSRKVIKPMSEEDAAALFA